MTASFVHYRLGPERVVPKGKFAALPEPEDLPRGQEQVEGYGLAGAVPRAAPHVDGGARVRGRQGFGRGLLHFGELDISGFSVGSGIGFRKGTLTIVTVTFLPQTVFRV